MKGFSFLFVFGLAASTQAARLPSCSAVCLTNAIATTGCKASNTQCICSSETFTSTVAECVEQSCTGDDKSSTLEIAEQFCLAAGVHTQLKKREAEPEAFGPGGPGGWETGNFKGSHGGAPGGWGRGRPSWGWGQSKSPVASAPTESSPVHWVPNFHENAGEWWKQQPAEWWKENGFNWWKANGNHFPGTHWWNGKDQDWWQGNAHNWYKGPSGSRGSNWSGGRPWWPAAPPASQTEPEQPSRSTPAPEEPSPTNPAPEWPDWSAPTEPSSASTPTPSPVDNHPHPTHLSEPHPTHTSEPWNPFKPAKPIQTVIPAE